MNNPVPEHYPYASVRDRIEQSFYRSVNEQSKLENLIRNRLFLEDAAKLPAFYSDHGVVHVRDVAKQVLRVLQTINGVLNPHAPNKNSSEWKIKSWEARGKQRSNSCR